MILDILTMISKKVHFGFSEIVEDEVIFKASKDVIGVCPFLLLLEQLYMFFDSTLSLS